MPTQGVPALVVVPCLPSDVEFRQSQEGASGSVWARTLANGCGHWAHGRRHGRCKGRAMWLHVPFFEQGSPGTEDVRCGERAGGVCVASIRRAALGRIVWDIVGAALSSSLGALPLGVTSLFSPGTCPSHWRLNIRWLDN